MTKPVLESATKTKLLLIEDNPGDARLIREVLTETRPEPEFELQCVDRLQSAFGWLDRQPADLILLDLSLPDTQGLATLERLRAQVPNIPIVILTGNKDERIALQALQLGAQDYVTKGEIGGRALMRSIRYALERTKSQSTLRALGNRLLTLVEASPIAIVGVDIEGRVTIWNAAAERTLGWQEMEMTGAMFSPAKKDQEPIFFDLRSRVLAGESVHGVEFSAVSKPGLLIHLHVAAAPLRGGNGDVNGIVYLVEDITEIQEMRETLRRSEERYRDLFENANDIVCTFDLDSQFTSANKKAEEMLGYSKEELLGRDIVSIASATNREDVLRALLSARESVNAVREIELLTKTGEALPLEVSTRVIFESGNPTGIQGIFRDIRERRKFEAQLQQASKMEALGRLAGGIAHDFNNLLTVITGYADLHLMALPRDSEMRKQVVPIITASYRAAELTRQLLAFSRQQIIRPRILDPGSIVKNLAIMMPRLIGETIELKVQINPNIGRIKGDPSQIEQVVMNLAVNARDAMPKGGRLTIEVANATVTSMQDEKSFDAEPGEYVMIAVSDNGTGMDEETRARIFEPFFSTKKPGEGTGLGLATVYGIVKQNRGFVWLQSERGRGTTFKIYLPRIFADASPDDRQTARPPRAGKETILVVEDEENVRTLIETALSGWGYHVLIAFNGDQALNICATHPGEIHLVISDLILPGISGREVISRISQSRKDTKFLVMSGYPGSSLAGQDELDPSMSFLQKPFAASQLSDQLWAIFEK
jgi:two-component system, cell cycle sensor histidine kinase and response regulator CckA